MSRIPVVTPPAISNDLARVISSMAIPNLPGWQFKLLELTARAIAECDRVLGRPVVDAVDMLTIVAVAEAISEGRSADQIHAKVAFVIEQHKQFMREESAGTRGPS